MATASTDGVTTAANAAYRKPAAPSKEEEHCLLQVPNDVADRLRALLQSHAEDAGGGAEVCVTFAEASKEGEPRGATLRVGGTELPGRLCNLPTVVETHKSLPSTDGSVLFYKTGHIGQVLVVEKDESLLPTELELKDGLAPPTANIRKRKWRKRPPRDEKALEQVQLELEALVRGGPPPPVKELIEEEIEEAVGPDGAGSSGAGASGTAPDDSDFGDDPDDMEAELEAELAEAEPPAKQSTLLRLPNPGGGGGGGARAEAPQQRQPSTILRLPNPGAASGAAAAAAQSAMSRAQVQQQSAQQPRAPPQAAPHAPAQAAPPLQAAPQQTPAQQAQQAQARQALQAQIDQVRHKLAKVGDDVARIKAMDVSANPALATKRDAKLQALAADQAKANAFIAEQTRRLEQM